MAKSFNEAFKEAREAGLATFTWQGNIFSTDLKEQDVVQESFSPPLPRPSEIESILQPELSASERLMQAMEDYEDNYNLRSIADVEYRADLDPYISGTPVSLLGFDEIYKETDGDIGQRMKVIMGEDDPNNITFYKGTPDEINMYGSTATGYYSPEEDERYYNGPSEAILGGAYASAHGEDPLEQRSRADILRTMAHELGHKGMRVLESKDPEHQISRGLEEILMKEFENRSEANNSLVDAGRYAGVGYTNLRSEIDDDSLNELRERGRPSIVKNKVKQVPDYLKKRDDHYFYERKSMLDKLRHFLAGKEKPVKPERKRQKELYRYAGGGIVSLLGKD